jgi:UDP-N-acetylmuramyl pentapeptide synthase
LKNIFQHIFECGFAVTACNCNHFWLDIVQEIAHLREIASPDIAIVTNTLDAHIGEFGGFNNLVKAKGEIYSNHSKNIKAQPMCKFAQLYACHELFRF